MLAARFTGNDAVIFRFNIVFCNLVDPKLSVSSDGRLVSHVSPPPPIWRALIRTTIT